MGSDEFISTFRDYKASSVNEGTFKQLLLNSYYSSQLFRTPIVKKCSGHHEFAVDSEVGDRMTEETLHISSVSDVDTVVVTVTRSLSVGDRLSPN